MFRRTLNGGALAKMSDSNTGHAATRHAGSSSPAPALPQPPGTDPDWREKIETAEGVRRESLRLDEDCMYSSRGHFEAERLWSRVHHWIGVPAALVGGAAGVSAFNQETLLAGSLAVVAAALTALATFLNPSARSAEHHTAGAKYLSLRNESRFLRETWPKPSDVDSFRDTLASLVQLRNELNESSRPIPRHAFKAARNRIEQGEAKYEVDVK